MLVLTRKEEESIVLDGGIEITVLKIGDNKVRIGIRAPSDVAIRRSELAGRSPAGLVLPGSSEGLAVDCTVV